MFNSTNGSAVFCQNPSFGSFGSSPAQTSPFGSAIQSPQPAVGSYIQQSQPAFGSSVFGSSTPFGASSQPTLGSMSTPAFGSSSIFGSSTPFGASLQPTFGSTATPAFGTTSTPAFGATNTTLFGSTSTPAFGSTGSAVGMSSAPVFGTQTPTQAFANTAIGQSEFQGRRGGSRVASYSATFVIDTPSTRSEKLESVSAIPFYKVKSHEELRWEYYELGKNDIGTSAETIFTLESILAMPVYKDKSHEELRWEDYQLGDKGGGSSFGGTPGMFDRATPQNSIVVQPAPINTNPFGTLPALPQMSIGRVGNTPSVQYGGPLPSAVQSTGMEGFNSSTIQTDAFSPSPAFDQSSANPNRFEGRHSMGRSLVILTGTMTVTVVISGWNIFA